MGYNVFDGPSDERAYEKLLMSLGHREPAEEHPHLTEKQVDMAHRLAKGYGERIEADMEELADFLLRLGSLEEEAR